MTRKHYRKLAQAFRLTNGAIRNGHLDSPALAVDYAIRQMAIILKEDNPNFNEQKFYTECSPNHQKET